MVPGKIDWMDMEERGQKSRAASKGIILAQTSTAALRYSRADAEELLDFLRNKNERLFEYRPGLRVHLCGERGGAGRAGRPDHLHGQGLCAHRREAQPLPPAGGLGLRAPIRHQQMRCDQAPHQRPDRHADALRIAGDQPAWRHLPRTVEDHQHSGHPGQASPRHRPWASTSEPRPAPANPTRRRASGCKSACSTEARLRGNLDRPNRGGTPSRRGGRRREHQAQAADSGQFMNPFDTKDVAALNEPLQKAFKVDAFLALSASMMAEGNQGLTQRSAPSSRDAWRRPTHAPALTAHRCSRISTTSSSSSPKQRPRASRCATSDTSRAPSRSSTEGPTWISTPRWSTSTSMT